MFGRTVDFGKTTDENSLEKLHCEMYILCILAYNQYYAYDSILRPAFSFLFYELEFVFKKFPWFGIWLDSWINYILVILYVVVTIFSVLI